MGISGSRHCRQAGKPEDIVEGEVVEAKTKTLEDIIANEENLFEDDE